MSQEEKEIKTSELLFNVSTKVDEMHLMMQNLQFNYSLILNRLQTLSLSSTQTTPSNIEKSKEISTKIPVPESEFSFAPVETNKVNENSKTRLVRQQVLAENSKVPILMAIVNIYTQDISLIEPSNVKSKLFASKKTDMKGFWSAKLPSGKYYIHILKPSRNTQDKNSIDYYNEIFVGDGTDVLQLEPVSSNGATQKK